MAIDRARLRPGMTVRNTNGDRIGRIAALYGDEMIVRRGRIFRADFPASATDVLEVRGDEVILALRGDLPGELNEGRNSASRNVDVARRSDPRLL